MNLSVAPLRDPYPALSQCLRVWDFAKGPGTSPIAKGKLGKGQGRRGTGSGKSGIGLGRGS